MDFLNDAYAWTKALHIIFVISWMAGMLYLPRLFVYHAEAEPGSEISEQLKVMERRLLRAIVNPAMVLTWLFGGALFFTPGIIENADVWFHIKFSAVFILSAVHGLFARWRKQFERDERKHATRTYRIWNEVPTLLMIVIVIMVVVRPV